MQGNKERGRFQFAALLVILLLQGYSLLAQADSPKSLGKLVDLGGHRLHVRCTGKGDPTVVVENGLGDFSFGWILVQLRVEKFTRICTYDRAGYAWSDPGPKPRSYAQLNLELHDALAKLGEHGPYILVGHSFGGPVVRNYALTYPKEVAGMVLVDTVQEDQRIEMGRHAGRIREGAKGLPIPEAHEKMLAADKTNLLPRKSVAADAKVEPPFDKLPPEYQKLQLWGESLPALEDAEDSQKMWSSEYLARWYASPQEGSLGTIPLIVLMRENGGFGNDLDASAAELESDRKRLQASLANLSKNGKLMVVNSGHNMHLEAPQVVCDAIQDVVKASRKN